MSPVDAAAAALREPCERLSDQRRVALFGMWSFIASEVLFFGAMFMTYAYERVLHGQAFHDAAQKTNLWLGTANSAILLVSSFTMVTAVRAADLDLRRPALRLLAATAALGVLFLVVKAFEYREDLAQALWPGQRFALPAPAAQIFFSFYWGVTAVHALHLTTGIVLVSRLAWLAWRERLPLPSPQFEVTALYWGFVDIIWLMLYPLIYLGGRP